MPESAALLINVLPRYDLIKKLARIPTIARVIFISFAPLYPAFVSLQEEYHVKFYSVELLRAFLNLSRSRVKVSRTLGRYSVS